MYLNSKSKRRVSKKSILFLLLIIAVLAVFTTGVIMLFTKGKDVKDTLIKMPFTAESSYFTVDNTLVYSDNDLLNCADPSLNQIWQIKLFTSGLKFTSCSNYIAATGNNVVMVVDSKGENLFSTQLNGTVRSVRLGKDKVAVDTDQGLADKTLSYIIIFDLKGNSLFQIDISGKYILDYGFDPQSEQLYILELDVSGSAAISRITSYRPETQSITGVKELKDQPIESVDLRNGAIYTMGTNRLSVYTSLNSAAKELLVYGWVLEDTCTTGNIRFVYIPSSSGTYINIARIISASGDETKINLPPNVFKIIDTGDKIYCFATNNIFVYTGSGKFLRTYSLPFAIDGAKRAMDGYVFLTAAENIYLLPLP